MRTRFLQSLAVLAMAATGACSGDSSGGSPAAPSTANAVTISILRQNGAQSFTPNPATAGGQPVVFRNDDSIVHHVTLNDGSVDTGDIAPGASSRVVMMPAGGTNYHCTLHPSMIGSVAAASGAPPPTCEGAYCSGDGY
jgi:plastocyanin